MEMNQIRYFLKAGETLNFTRAAEQCGVSPRSAVGFGSWKKNWVRSSSDASGI
jgi:hypothetical protein